MHARASVARSNAPHTCGRQHHALRAHGRRDVQPVQQQQRSALAQQLLHLDGRLVQRGRAVAAVQQHRRRARRHRVVHGRCRDRVRLAASLAEQRPSGQRDQQRRQVHARLLLARRKHAADAAGRRCSGCGRRAAADERGGSLLLVVVVLLLLRRRVAAAVHRTRDAARLAAARGELSMPLVHVLPAGRAAAATKPGPAAQGLCRIEHHQVPLLLRCRACRPAAALGLPLQHVGGGVGRAPRRSRSVRWWGVACDPQHQRNRWGEPRP
jgi:hypothetical protein